MGRLPKNLHQLEMGLWVPTEDRGNQTKNTLRTETLFVPIDT